MNQHNKLTELDTKFIHFYNVINSHTKVAEEFYSDFVIYKLYNQSERFSAIPLDIIENKIEAIFYLQEKIDKCIVVMFKKNNSPTNEEIAAICNSDEVRTFVLEPKYKDIRVILNLFLLQSQKQAHCCSALAINGHYYNIVERKKHMLVTLDSAFKYSNNGLKNEIVLTTDVSTFSQIDFCKENVLNKQNTFFEEYGDIIIKTKNQDGAYIKHNWTSKKNSVNAYSLEKSSVLKDNLKVQLLSYINNIFQSHYYIKNFNFASLELSKYISNRNRTVENHINDLHSFYLTHGLHVITNGIECDLSALRSMDELLDVDITFSNEAHVEKPNICLLDISEKEKSQKWDEIYKKNKLMCLITQGIDAKSMNDKSIIATCLSELAIKHNLKNSVINIFDWTLFDDVHFKELTFVTKAYDADINDFSFFFITINVHSGDILFSGPVDDCDFELAYSLECEAGTWLAYTDTGLSIFSKNTDKVMVPNFDLYDAEIEKVKAGQDLEMSFEEWLHISKFLANDNLDFKNLISNSSFFLDQHNCGKLFHVKDILSLKNELNNPLITKSMKNKLDAYFREEDIAIELHIKGKETLNKIFPSLEGLSCNEKYYVVSDCFEVPKQQSKHLHLKELHYGENTDFNFFLTLIPLFFVPFVRHNKMSAIPFPIKYLNELIEQYNFQFSE